LIVNFGNKAASDLYHKGFSSSVPKKFWQRSVFLFDIMEAVESLAELKTRGFPPSLRLHKLKGSRTQEWAIDIHKTDGWRITFKFKNNEFTDVKIENYH
jgi:plasmid maintenance system killer protein